MAVLNMPKVVQRNYRPTQDSGITAVHSKALHVPPGIVW